MSVFSHAGDQFAISTTAQNADLDQSGFEALTYTAVGNIGSLGEYGISTNALTYDTWNTVVDQKAKGRSNAGDPPLEVARLDSDAGQQAMIVAGAPNYYDAHAYKVTKQDGHIDYLRGLVGGPVSPSGRNEDFDIHVFTLMLVQAPLPVLASV